MSECFMLKNLKYFICFDKFPENVEIKSSNSSQPNLSGHSGQGEDELKKKRKEDLYLDGAMQMQNTLLPPPPNGASNTSNPAPLCHASSTASCLAMGTQPWSIGSLALQLSHHFQVPRQEAGAGGLRSLETVDAIAAGAMEGRGSWAGAWALYVNPLEGGWQAAGHQLDSFILIHTVALVLSSRRVSKQEIGAE